MSKQLILKKSVIAVALTLVSSQFFPAYAQSSAQAENKGGVEKVVVTGSNIKRGADQETSSPVQVISREEITAIGASTVKDILDTLTANTGALTDLGGGNSFASGASGVSLRNLGKGSTLTLLNGRRISNYGFADGGQETFVNIDTLPTEIIDRIEVLLDGASAIYGSDAVAGVINVITKREFQGVTLKGGARQSLVNSVMNKDQTASITAGIGDLRTDGYNVFGNLEAFHRSPYSDRAIEKSVPSWYTDYVNPSFGVKSSYSYPGNYVGRYPANYADPALAGKSFNTPAPGCAPENITGGLCRFDQYDRLGAHAEAKRYNFFGGGRLNLSNGMQAFSEVTYSDTTTSYYNAPPIMQYTGSASTWYSVKDQALKSFTEPRLPVGHPNNPYSFPVELRYRYADDPNMFKSVAHAKQYRVMVGLEGSDYGWDWNTAVGAMASTADNQIRGPKHAANYLAAVLSGEYKFGGQNSAELLNRMFPTVVFGGETKQVFIDARATRELMALPGGPLSLAIGGDFRTDKFNAYVSDNIANAEIVGYGAINVEGSRHMSAAYAELNAPLTKALEVNGAVRVDKVGQTETSIVPKVGMRFEVTRGLILRGTVAQGFRAPNAAETGKVALSAFQNSIQDPKRCATAQAMYAVLNASSNPLDKADALRVRDSLGCATSFAVSTDGNAGLAPEKSKSYNFGVVLEPTRDLTLTLDYYRIERRNEIGTKSVDQVLSSEDGVPGSVQRAPVSADDQAVAARVKELSGKDLQFSVGRVSALSQRYENLNKTRVSGLDMELTHRWNLGSAGRLSSSIRANYQLDYRSWDTVTNDYTENLVGTYENYRYNIRATSNWKKGAWNVGGALTYLPGTKLITDKYDQRYTAQGCEDRNFPADYCKLDKDYVVDANLSYAGFKNSTILFYINNVFNRAAVVDLRASTSIPPVRGRTARVAYEYKF
ncbi:TonB-dependent receptor domain-containing protein [Janthinobacterium agaricidamnosum]|uniref:TonB-dependent Receptor Plug domain protein n=1 Tax=Janthinobacterium agaricidamnosum NBRC 102515 = DSM 9628 TaxID=1349767 RepID=W0V630_9BURK|nr:TonB-dependent receptor [Janthinobacterium agaricidamnosum]CDG83040.1 tonB-dependent Receptor Plug domain protein [Janthinobacterium agaricidamnosum NBRC 102515 = DSM 9628]